MNYIILDKNDVIGCFDKKIVAISSFIDILIYKYKTIDDLKMSQEITFNKINSCKIVSILKNSTMIKGVYKFNIKKLNFDNLISDEYLLDRSEKINFNYKFNILKNLQDEVKKNKISSESECNNYEESSESECNNYEEPSESECNNYEETFSNDKININVIKANIEKLRKMKNDKELILSKKRHEKLNAERELNNKKEKIDEYRRKFYADKQIYHKISSSINDESNIPELFQDQYPIFSTLSKLNILESENAFLFYYKKMNEINKLNILNNKYSNMFNDSALFYTKNKETFSDSENSESEKSDFMSKIADKLNDSEISDNNILINSDANI